MTILQKILLALVHAGRRINEFFDRIRGKDGTAVPDGYETSENQDMAAAGSPDEEGNKKGKQSKHKKKSERKQLPALLSDIVDDPGKARTVILICGAVLILVFCVVFAVKGKSQNRKVTETKKSEQGSSAQQEDGDIDLADYLTVTFSGYEGYGTATVTFDRSSLLYDLTGLTLGEEGTENTGSVRLTDENYEAAIQFYEEASWEISKSEGLSNGDAVTVSLSYPEKAASTLGLSVLSGGVLYSVSGLEELTETDVLSSAAITLSGYFPNASASASWAKGTEWEDIGGLSVTPSSHVGEGDSLTVSLSEEAVEELASKYGITPARTSAKTQAEGTGKWLTDTEDITADMLTAIESQALSTLDKTSSSWESWVELKEASIEGVWLCTPEDMSTLGSATHASAIYAAISVTVEVNGNTAQYTMVIGYYDPAITSDGELSIDWNETTGCLGGTNIDSLTFEGYSSVTEAEKNIPWDGNTTWLEADPVLMAAEKEETEGTESIGEDVTEGTELLAGTEEIEEPAEAITKGTEGTAESVDAGTEN